MFSLIKKELSSFFGSLTGYIIAIVYLVINGLFLWFFSGNFNIPESGYSSLQPYFELAPWLFLFLIPALTMRLFAEEKRLGTFEILLTRPFSNLQLVLSKYIAALVLVFLCLLPTLVYFYSVYQLGNPIGNWDGGAAWGSFIGLFFLAATYLAIGVFCSSLTDNPIISFVLSLLLCFFFYAGFGFLGELNVGSSMRVLFLRLAISSNYESMSRGVLDSRDLLYFVLVSFSFLLLTAMFLRRNSKLFKKKLLSLSKYIVALVIILLLAQQWFFRLDLTSEKRYSLSEITKNKLTQLKYPLHIELYLTGELPPAFRQLKQAIKEKVQDMNAWASVRVNIYDTDPYEITDAEQRKQLFNQLINIGIQPTDIRQNTEEGTSTKLVFPGAVIQYGDYYVGINLLKNNPTLSAEQNLNNSIEILEYEFTNALQTLLQEGEPKEVSFLQGHGELSDSETYDIRNALQSNYKVTNTTAQQIFEREVLPQALIIANPQTPFSEQDKFYIDQYLMQGGSLMYLVDPVQVSLDSLSIGETTIAFSRELNLHDQLFRYGVRINPDLIQDVECLFIPVNTSPVASQPKFKPAPWYYSPLLSPSEKHSISRNINRLKSEFVSSIDTVGSSNLQKKTIVLHSSQYSRRLNVPAEVSLKSVNSPPSRELFNTSYVPTGVLVEGQFKSVFANRPTEKYNEQGIEVKSQSEDAKIIVFSDGNLIANKVSNTTGELRTQPLGYDQYSQQTFGNKELLLNAVNYLCDNEGTMELRSRVFKLRLLDKVKLREELTYWKWFNLLAPILLITLLGMLYQIVRIYKYKK